MKKITFLILLMSFITACTVEETTVEINDTAIQAEDLECVIDQNNPPPIMGSVWARTSFLIETELDGNGDGIFTNDLEIETTCDADFMTFGTNFQAGNPTFHNMFVEVEDDGNGNLSQTFSCLIGDGLFPFYTQDGNIITFCYSGEVAYTATLSTDEQTLTFVFPKDDIFFQNIPTTILKQDGTIEELQGDVTLIYTRQ